MWIWRYHHHNGETSASAEFPSQGDAETWLGESWRELLSDGVAQVTLLESDRVGYGPMPLTAD